ncbi:discoidin domain-containing protein [Clostridium cochlearium]|nr:discoidin domain-containing protein [Clostridium cochlearium]
MVEKNLALNRPIIASESHHTGYTPEKAVDGDLSTGSGYLTSSATSAYLTIELDNAYAIQMVKLKQVFLSSYKGRCKNFVILASNDNDKYTILYEGMMQNDSALQEFPIKNTESYKYIRLLIKDNYEGYNSSNGIGEIEIYGTNYKFLIKQTDGYYSIKSEYYSDGKFQSLYLEGGEQPNENDYEKFGFMKINDILKPIQVGEETFKPYDKLENEFEICMATEKNGGIS